MEDFISFYVNNRMKELGKTKGFHMSQERTTVLTTDTTVMIEATNEIWILFDVSQLTDAFTIDASNRRVTQAGFDAAGLPYIIYELTGDIIITRDAATLNQTFLFYRIIPN